MRNKFTLQNARHAFDFLDLVENCKTQIFINANKNEND